MQLIISKAEAIHNKKFDYYTYKVEFVYKGNEYKIWSTSYDPETWISGITTSYGCGISPAYTLREIYEMIISDGQIHSITGKIMNTSEIFTMFANVIDHKEVRLTISKAENLQPVNDVEVIIKCAEYDTE